MTEDQHVGSLNKEILAEIRVVITGGPGAGKTAVLELVQKTFCEHVAVLPEAASIIFGGGFPRHDSISGRRAAQRSIFYIQRELEQLAQDEKLSSIVLCDRGTIDGLAYWPGDETDFWKEVNSSKVKELARYQAVIHLRTPPSHNGYNHQNPLRTETAMEASVIDDKIAEAWKDHPRRFIVDSEQDFLIKVHKTLELIRNEIPPSCTEHFKDLKFK
jgi:predicted ATPase